MKQGRKIMACLLMALMMMQTITVLAAGTVTISMKAVTDDRQLTLDCIISQEEKISNGKLRIYYDADKVTLLSSEPSDLLSGAMCEINDCISGNKPEGEIVAAFASSKNLDSKGSLLKLKFQLKDNVAKGDEVKFRVQPEKLASDSTEVKADTKEFTYKVGVKGEQGTDNSGKGEDNSCDKNDSKDKGKDSNGAKTGDDTPVMAYILLGGGALLLIVICTVVVRRRKEKE